MNKEYKSVREIKEHGEAAIGKRIRELVSKESVNSWYVNPKNKGWIGNSIEKDWFGLENNSRPEADFDTLGVELKCAGLKFFKRDGFWAANERLVLNIFDYDEKNKKDFQTSSFLKKSNLIKLVLYKYDPIEYYSFEGKEYPIYPDFIVSDSILFNLYDLMEEDLDIIRNDWELIMNMIREGRADEISEGMTQYLGAVTKGGKKKKNLTSQPFSDKRAHRRAFSLKPSYMKEITRRIVNRQLTSSTTYDSYVIDYPELHEQSFDTQYDTREHIITNPSELHTKTFEEIILNRLKPYHGMNKKILGEEFGVNIPAKNDKASSRLITQKMFNLQNDLEETDEFKKAGIVLKIITVKSNKRKKESKKRLTTEGFKLESDISFIKDICDLEWEDTRVYDYLSTTKFLLFIYEETSKGEIFKGAKFWYMPEEDLVKRVSETWRKKKKILIEGVELTYKPVNNKKGFVVINNLPSNSNNTGVLHIRPSAEKSEYFEGKNSSRLPTPARWKNRPENMENVLTNDYMVKQAFWLNKNYMYQQVKEYFE
ncbi:MutH/Sau3AI family endonuclease [Exiguobacterium profundum]|uniref:MutH/Sau3AI family endonuclease n=1 Tax=Exiguobacterium profundum TaxID=307643 RepID=UPI00093A2E41|nr:MutH/Sau3AI family endonuclease [Exiguobacterium profundum]